MADEVLSKIEEKVKNNKVMVYMKGTPDFPQCGFSAHTVEILRSYGVPVRDRRCARRCGGAGRHQAILELADDSAGLYRRQVRRRLRHRARAARARRARADA